MSKNQKKKLKKQIQFQSQKTNGLNDQTAINPSLKKIYWKNVTSRIAEKTLQGDRNETKFAILKQKIIFFSKQIFKTIIKTIIYFKLKHNK